MPENGLPKVRAFIAIELSSQMKGELARLQERLKRACNYCPARWVATENMHLTLNFLGDVPVARLDDIKEAIKQACAEFEPFKLSLDGLGAFPNLVRPHVVWAGLSGDIQRLSQLQQQLERLLEGLGFNHENRLFSPHLTLARVKDEASPADKRSLGQAIASTSCETACDIPVLAVHLIKSQLTAAGPVYTVLFLAALG